jgi:hypothetical protein
VPGAAQRDEEGGMFSFAINCRNLYGHGTNSIQGAHMGSSVDSRRIDMVLRRHRRELIADLRHEQPSKLVRKFTLEAGIDAVGVTIHLRDGTVIDISKYWDVDVLVERFPGCA